MLVSDIGVLGVVKVGEGKVQFDCSMALTKLFYNSIHALIHYRVSILAFSLTTFISSDGDASTKCSHPSLVLSYLANAIAFMVVVLITEVRYFIFDI